jgi:hypothetical protein
MTQGKIFETLLSSIAKNKIETYQADGREKIENLYAEYFDLLKNPNWEMEKVANSTGAWRGKKITLPILAFKTKNPGPAIYILSGIHGEEPTGPNAIAQSVETLIKLGKETPLVLIPLCNPLGYVRNWRYLNKEKYSDSPKIEGLSVGDSEHLLPDVKNPNKPRRETPADSECAALSKYILKIGKKYPPKLSLDFHGDVLIPKGYLYSQGKFGINDETALKILNILEHNDIPIQRQGETRFGEKIENGLIGRQTDGSIDELISAKEIFVNGKIKPGPNADQVFVLETPDADLPLEKRVSAYKAVIAALKNLF